MKVMGIGGGLVAVAVAVALPLGAAAAPARALGTMVVSSTGDTVALDGQCTLREAIQNHNAAGAVNVDCSKGHSNDKIAFSVGGTIILGSELPAVQKKLSIDGGFSITIDGASSSRIIETASSANLTLRRVSLAHGLTAGDGGAVLNTDAKLTLEYVTLSNNTAAGSGGGVYSPGGSAKIVHSTFDHNTATNSGGLGGLDLQVNDSSFTFNNATQYGGALYTFAMRMTDSFVANNTAGIAFGGLATGGPGVLDHVVIDSNAAPQGAGGAIQQAGGTHFLADAITVRDNVAGCPGGGLVVFILDADSSVLLRNSTIDGNSTTSGGCGLGGGGLLQSGPGALTVANSTVANNVSASGLGGGIYSSSDLTLLNVTVSGNSVAGGSGAGGLYADSASTATFANTILFGNTDGDDAECGGPGTFHSTGHNIAGDGTCHLTGDGDQPTTDPDLGPLTDNGGATETMLPGPTSPALDVASRSVCKARPVSGKDQRGVTRKAKKCDIGSVERRD